LIYFNFAFVVLPTVTKRFVIVLINEDDDDDDDDDAAGEIRMLASAKLMSEAKNVGHGRVDVISTSDVLEVLHLQLTVAECDVFAYPSIESDIVIIIMPITASPTSLQVIHPELSLVSTTATRVQGPSSRAELTARQLWCVF